MGTVTDTRPHVRMPGACKAARRAHDISATEHGRVSWVMLVTVAVLAGGLWVWLSLARPSAPAAPPVVVAPTAPAPDDTSDAVIEQALGQVPVDSTELRNRWLDEVKFADVSALSAAQRDLFVRAANTRRCTCGCGFTLATCRAYDTTCPVSGGYAEALIDSVRRGRVRDRALRERPGKATKAVDAHAGGG